MADGDQDHRSTAARNRSRVINARFLAKPVGGVPRVGVELLRALSDELVHCAAKPRLSVATPRSVDLCQLGAQHAGRRTLGFASRVGEQLAMPLLYPRATVISFCNATPMLAADSVVWIHDAHVFDAAETYPLPYRLWHKTILGAVRLRGFQVVTVSEFARDRLLHYGVDPTRIRVIYNGGDHIVRTPEDSEVFGRVGLYGEPYVLLVGSPARHKNLPFALSALLTAPANYNIAVLGLAQSGPYQSADSLSRHPRVFILPHVTDAELRALYRSAKAVISPSLCEGFGLYAAEAMFAESGPLVLSNRAALPEVAGDAALYFDPTDAASLVDEVTAALQPAVAQRLREAARKQREKFRWRRAAREIIQYYLS